MGLYNGLSFTYSHTHLHTNGWLLSCEEVELEKEGWGGGGEDGVGEERDVVKEEEEGRKWWKT